MAGSLANLKSSMAGGRPANPGSIGKEKIDIVAMQMGDALVFLPGAFDDDKHVKSALKKTQKLKPLKEGYLRKAMGFQSAIDEFVALDRITVTHPPPSEPQHGHPLFKARGLPWMMLTFKEPGDYAHFINRAIELHNTVLKSSAPCLTIVSFKKNLSDFGINKNEKLGTLTFSLEQWTKQCYRLSSTASASSGCNPRKNPVIVHQMPSFYAGFGAGENAGGENGTGGLDMDTTRAAGTLPTIKKRPNKVITKIQVGNTSQSKSEATNHSQMSGKRKRGKDSESAAEKLPAINKRPYIVAESDADNISQIYAPQSLCHCERATEIHQKILGFGAGDTAANAGEALMPTVLSMNVSENISTTSIQCSNSDLDVDFTRETPSEGAEGGQLHVKFAEYLE